MAIPHTTHKSPRCFALPENEWLLYKQLTEILKRHGYRFLRPGKGDHEIWGNDRIQRPVDRNSRSRYTANAILKQFGISERI